MSSEFWTDLFSHFFGCFGWILEVWNIVVDAVWPSTHEKSVKGQNVLLIGSGDIGQELAKGLKVRGARIAFWDADQKTLDQINEEFPREDGEKLITQKVDVRRVQEVQEAAKVLWSEHHFDVDILLNAAGVAHEKDCFDEPIEQIDKIIDVNVKGLTYVMRTFLPKFYERKHGHLVSIASLAGTIGCSHVCEYSASKHAVIGYMDSLSVDALARGLHELEFTTLCPGFIQTKMVAKTSYTGNPKWTISTVEEAGEYLLRAILQDRRQVIWPWEARLIVSFKHVLSAKRMHQFLARQWNY